MPTDDRPNGGRFARLFQRVGTGIAVAAADGRFLDVNPAFCATVGYSPDELASHTIASLTHPDDWPHNRELVTELLSGERDAFSIEKRYVTKDRGPVWVRAHVSLLREEDGTVQLVATTEDITAQKRVEARLEQSQTLLRIAGEVGRVGGWAIDTEPVKLYWSDEVHDLAGYPRGHTPPLDEALALYPPSERDRMAAAVETCMSDGTAFDIECAFHPRGGAERWVRVVGEARRDADGDVDRIQGAIIDISEQKRAQLELEERGARLSEQAALLDEAQDAIVVRDLEGRITYWNRSAERIYGWTAEEARGRSMRDLLGIDQSTYATASAQLLEQGNWFDEVTKRAKDGRQLVVEARWALVRDDRGEPTSVLGIDTDVTERKRIEEQFLRAQRMETIGKLAGGIAHDLNNALVPISASIELLRAREEDPLKLRMLAVMESSAKHGAEMLDQVLSFARGVEGRREPVSVGAAIDEVLRMSEDTFPKNIALEADVAEDLWPVVGDPTQLQQVLVNLCVNARDAMPEGGTLTVSAMNSDRDGRPAADRSADPFVTIRVTDTGVGMSSEVLTQVFDPFFSTKPTTEGTGLGLSTTAVIVDSHGGMIDVDSRPGRGTSFAIRLPGQPDASRTTTERGTAPPQGDGQLVLLVEDEDGVREITRMLLESSGYRVVSAHHGEEAIAILEERREEVAVVVTDLMMPVMDGFALLDRVRALDADLPVIATSGLHTAEASERSLAAGATRFVAKPYGSEAFLRVVDEVANHHVR